MKRRRIFWFLCLALLFGHVYADGSLGSYPEDSTSSDTTVVVVSNYQEGYEAGVADAINTCRADPLSCDIFDSVRYWEAYYLGVDTAINTCYENPGSCGIKGTPWYDQGYAAAESDTQAACRASPGSCGIDTAPWYNEGFQAGLADGKTQGFDAGMSVTKATCKANPGACGIDTAPWYNEGFQAGLADGKTQGFDAGMSVTKATCKANPGACGIDTAPWYNEGYQAGRTDGKNACKADPVACGVDTKPWYDEGYAKGFADCREDPLFCGVLLADVLPAPAYGETEPNDHIVAADPLVLDVPFWGQSYGASDTDWFYLETDTPNQTLTINFAVPGATTPAGWLISIRDAAGNLYASIDSATATTSTAEAGDITYSLTLGLVGTYYVEVKSTSDPVSPNPYTLAAMLQESPLATGNFQVGFYDAEVEPNNQSDTANPLTTGVTMYGLINLTFDVAVPQDDEYVWAQGENDWFKYTTKESEIITLTFCAREACGPGDWFIDVYEESSGALILAYNTSTDETDTDPKTIRFGLKANSTYVMRVDHKRLYTAPCTDYETDWDNDGLPGPNPQACACTDGYQCSLEAPNPVENITAGETYEKCPDGSGGGTEAQCSIGCICTNYNSDGQCTAYQTDWDNNGVVGPEPTACACSDGDRCSLAQLNPTKVDIVTYDQCPDGSGGGTEAQCSIGCVCTAFGGVVEIPEGAITGQYNFTWYGTDLAPFTSDSAAYQDYLDRLKKN